MCIRDSLSLTQYPKSATPPSSYRRLIQEIINSFKKPTVCFTDGSKIHNRSGFAYLIGNSIYSHRHRNSASVYTTELQAICDCLEQILTLPHLWTNNTYPTLSSEHLVGIPSNEKVDKATKLATHFPSVSKSSLPSNSDLFLYINNVIHSPSSAIHIRSLTIE